MFRLIKICRMYHGMYKISTYRVIYAPQFTQIKFTNFIKTTRIGFDNWCWFTSDTEIVGKLKKYV